MKTLVITFIFCLSFCVAGSKNAHTQVNRKILDKPISIPAGTIRIDSLLKQFSRQTAIEFSFNSNKISPSKTLVAGSQKKTVSQWLAILNKSFGIQHKFVGNHIILIDNSNRKPVTQKTSAVGKNSVSDAQNKSGNVSFQKDRSSSVKQSESTAIIDSPAPVEPLYDSLQSRQRTSLTHLSKPLPDTISREQLIAYALQGNSHENVKQKTETFDLNDAENNESVQVMLGYSIHGSGDMKGIVFGSEYWKELSKKFSLGFMLRGSINSQKHEIIFNNTISGVVTDASVRFTTAGVQLGVLGAYHFINTLKSKFGLDLGVFGRYQSASNGSDGYSVIYPPVSSYPGALIEYNNTTPQHTVSLGGLFQLQYLYKINTRIYTGFVAGFQTDTNGDAIPQVGLVFGRNF